MCLLDLWLQIGALSSVDFEDLIVARSVNTQTNSWSRNVRSFCPVFTFLLSLSFSLFSFSLSFQFLSLNLSLFLSHFLYITLNHSIKLLIFLLPTICLPFCHFFHSFPLYLSLFLSHSFSEWQVSGAKNNTLELRTT